MWNLNEMNNLDEFVSYLISDKTNEKNEYLELIMYMNVMSKELWPGKKNKNRVLISLSWRSHKPDYKLVMF